MSATSRIIDLMPRRFVSLGEDLPQAYFFLEGGRIGNGALIASELDSNGQRTVYLVRVETMWGELSAMFEMPATSEIAARDLRECDAAVRALDAVSYSFENGATASLDADTGFWAVTMGGETIATACERGDALAIAHRQVAA